MSEQPNAIDMQALTFTHDPVEDVPPGTGPEEVKVARSYQLPVDLDHWIIQTAAAKGVKPAALVRDLLELGRTAYQDADRPVCLADVLAALASVRSRDAA